MMLPNLELRQVGTRHVVSDGVNDLGCIGEAHLKSYVASLPGALCGTSSQGVRTAFAGAAMKELTLRRDGDQHVVSDGKNDLGQIEDGHLKAYTLKLPGAYYQTEPPQAGAVTAAGQRPGAYPPSGAITGGNVSRPVINDPPTAAGIRPGGMSRGEARRNFTQAMETHKKRLLSEDPRLTELDAHRLAM